MNGKKISRNLKSSIQLFWVKYSGIIIGLLVFSFIVFVLLSLNIFYVHNFDIEPFSEDDLIYLDEEELQDVLAKYIGVRLFDLDPADVERTIKNEFSFVRSVYVSKRAPNSLSIKIVERIPTLKLIRNKDVVLLDDEGSVLGECVDFEKYCNSVPPMSVPYYLGDINIGSKPFITEIDEVVALAQSEGDLGLDITEFVVPVESVISVVFEDGSHGLFSTEKNLSSQIDKYSYTRENLLLKNERFKEIDLRFDRPVIRVDKYTY